jgi:hypothetical protein
VPALPVSEHKKNRFIPLRLNVNAGTFSSARKRRGGNSGGMRYLRKICKEGKAKPPDENLGEILKTKGEKQMQTYIITMLLIGFAAILGYLIFTGDKS